jgi:hypothetical protein
MRLPRLGDSIEDRVIEEAASVALVNGGKIVNLSDLRSCRGRDVRQVGMAIQKHGYGRLLEIAGNGEREYHLSITSIGFDFATEIRNFRRSKTIGGRLEKLNWSAVNAIAALIAAVAASLAAYFSYLALGKH